MSAPVLFEVANGWGVATLNRADALNALTLEMIRLLRRQLDAWAVDPAIQAVMIEGAGDKAFCAGGDVVAIYHAILEERRSGVPSALTRDFFFEEYQLNAAIARFPKPYVALLDGITMGGGVGLSAGASHRIVGPGYMFAMPETGIGLFPDVGGGWYLPRLVAGFGDYLALTGARVGAGDAMALGLASDFVEAADWAEMRAALRACTWDGASGAAIDRALAPFRGAPPAGRLAIDSAAIADFFAETDFGALWARIQAGGDPLTEELRQTLAAKSPTSLRVSHEQLKRGASMTSIEEVLTMEYRLSQHSMAGHDFSEGVRALLVDKDKSPNWRPASVDTVPDSLVESFFAPTGARELTW